MKKWIGSNPGKYTVIIVLVTFFFLTAPLAMAFARLSAMWGKDKTLPAGTSTSAETVQQEKKP